MSAPGTACRACGAAAGELLSLPARARDVFPPQCEVERCSCGAVLSFLAPLTREAEFWQLGVAGGALVTRFAVQRPIARAASAAPAAVDDSTEAA